MASRIAPLLASLCLAAATLTGASVASAEPDFEDPPRLPTPWVASPVARLSFAHVEERLQDDTDSASTSAPGTVSASRVELLGQLGLVGSRDYGGLLAGATALAHQGQLGYGGTFEFSGLLSSRLGAAVTAGWSRRFESGLGLDLLGALGAHRYSGVGRALLSSDPGVDATLPFAGLRGRVSYLTGTSGTRFLFGATVALDQDLLTVTRSSTYQETWDSPSGSSHEITSTHRVGYRTVGLMLDAGVHFD